VDIPNMFDPGSRYYGLETLVYRTADGRSIPYKARRFCPPAASLSTLTSVQVGDNDRLDLIAARNLGDPLRYWQICDANNADDPGRLIAQPGRLLLIPVPQAWPAADPSGDSS
jgi:hypothetical protein